MLPKTSKSFMIADIMKDVKTDNSSAQESTHSVSAGLPVSPVRSEATSTRALTPPGAPANPPCSAASSPDSALNVTPENLFASREEFDLERKVEDDSGFTSPDRLSPSSQGKYLAHHSVKLFYIG